MSNPDGYKLVPVNSTLEMINALKAELLTTSKGGILRAGIAINAAIAVAPVPPQASLNEQQQAYFRLNEHNNECEKLLDEATYLLEEIAKSGQAYRECTDKGSPTGQRIAAILASVAPFQPEPCQPESTNAESVKIDDWHMNPCKKGHRDVGAAGGVAHCYQCDEKIVASTTQDAFERWNSTHAKGQSFLSTTSN